MLPPPPTATGSVPNTIEFSLQNVINAINSSKISLLDCVNLVTDLSDYDSDYYNEAVNSMLNFRNFNMNKPVANFTLNVNPAVADGNIGVLIDTPIQFTDTTIHNPDQWLWSFTKKCSSDEQNSSSDEQNPNLTYDTAGIIDVSLKVYKYGVLHNTKIVNNCLTIYNKFADFTISNTNPKTGEQVTFEYYGTSTTSYTYNWNISNTTNNFVFSTLSSFSHIWNTANTYSITLVVSNGVCTDTITKTINVTNASCFLAGTKITMGNNTFKNIEDIKIDDIILSYNEINKKVVKSKVKKLLIHTKNNTKEWEEGYYIIKTQNNSINVTGNHPIYTIINDKETYVRADKLKINDLIRIYINNTTVIDKIISIQFIKEDLKVVYNLEVSNTHNYFANNILAHNKGYDKGKEQVSIPSQE